MQLIPCVQRSPEWWEARRGVPTASEFDQILTPKTLKPSTSQDKYIHALVAQKYANSNQWPSPEEYSSIYMERGIEYEDDARKWYAFDTGSDVKQVGFCLSDCGRYGCSPDGIVNGEGLLEIKCPAPGTHIGYLLNGELPADYKCQVHGQLVVTGLQWVDFMSYCEGLPSFVVRVKRDDFTDLLRIELASFCAKLSEAIKKIEGMRNVSR